MAPDADQKTMAVLGLQPPSSGLQQCVPPAHLLSLGLLHGSPVSELFLPGAVQTQGDPAYHLLPLHAAPVIHRQDQSHVGELKQGHLKDKRFLVHWIWLPSAGGCLAFGHLLAHGIQQC